MALGPIHMGLPARPLLIAVLIPGRSVVALNPTSVHVSSQKCQKKHDKPDVTHHLRFSDCHPHGMSSLEEHS
ncbi:hypothetical protein Y1Q_0001941 [Alligator mississippiensis]|uniref:Secreted protein n=1 Tax=Alligator mississippiensis TaxID=8496 RepID=A0A151PG97_ALLMI|nr:hypothetical protein Y1Q_0001941 [Alligator mississippiensis]